MKQIQICLLIGIITFCCYCVFNPEVYTGETEDHHQNIVKKIDKVENTTKKYISAKLAPTDRLGNHIFELTTLYSIAEILGRTPVYWNLNEDDEKMLNDTEVILPGLIEKFLVINGTVPEEAKIVEFHNLSRVYDDPKKLLNISNVYLHLNGNYYQSWKYFPKKRLELLGFLKIDGNFTGLPVSDALSSITCIHTRRGDFEFHRFYMSDADFVRKAEEYLRVKARKPSKKIRKVILFGDDQHFMKSIFENTRKTENDSRMMQVHPNENREQMKVNRGRLLLVPPRVRIQPEHFQTIPHFVSSNSAVDDLIYDSHHCDNVLITAPGSTFGWWMGYFSKGNNVYYLDIRNQNDRVYNEGRMNLKDFFLPHWTMLRFENGTVEKASI